MGMDCLTGRGLCIFTNLVMILIGMEYLMVSSRIRITLLGLTSVLLRVMQCAMMMVRGNGRSIRRCMMQVLGKKIGSHCIQGQLPLMM